jgi:hypothetical protein
MDFCVSLERLLYLLAQQLLYLFSSFRYQSSFSAKLEYWFQPLYCCNVLFSSYPFSEQNSIRFDGTYATISDY